MTAWEKARHEANRLELALQTALHHKGSAEQEAVRAERERSSLWSNTRPCAKPFCRNCGPTASKRWPPTGWKPCSTACLNAVNAGYPGKSGVTSYSKK